MMTGNASDRPLRIGYLASGLFNSYNQLVWQGVSDYCREQDSVFIYFAGGEPGSPDFTQASRNFIFDLAAAPVIDGVVVNSATTFHHVDDDRILQFYKMYSDLPLVSIGVKHGKWPAVMTDGYSGVRSAMQHLIEDHGYRKIAFIAGPEKHAESRQRLDAYRDALNESGTGFDASLVVHGNFLATGGVAGLDTLLARKAAFRAVLCASDETAFGAMQRARELGIAIPGDLAVCGFDNILAAATTAEPLSTVEQPIKKGAYEACRILFDVIRGKPQSGDLVLPTSFIKRRSCGCLSPAAERAAALPDPGSQSAALVIGKSANDDPASKSDFWSVKLLDGLKAPEDAFAEDFDAACRVLADAARKYVENGMSLSSLDPVRQSLSEMIHGKTRVFSVWEDAISGVRSRLLAMLCAADWPAVDAFFQSCRVLIQESSFLSHFTSESAERRKALHSREISWRIIRSFDLPLLIEALTAELPQMGIDACYLCLLETGSSDSANARLVMAYDTTGPVSLPAEGHVFFASELIPASCSAFEKSGDFFIDALFVEDRDRLGYLLYCTEPGVLDFEDFRRQISSALKGALLTREVHSLAQAHQQRANELAAAYDALKANQQKMIAVEKMASIGRLTAGIAHEMNTPIATIRAAVLELEALIDEYRSSIGNREVDEEDHRAIALEMNQDAQLIKKAAERTAAFVQSVKTQTRDLSKTSGRDFDAVRIIEEVILILGHMFKKENCSVDFRHPEEPVLLYGAEGRFSQVVTNLLTNAVDAMRPRGGGPLVIELMDSGSEILLSVEDKGVGISDDALPYIFDPMFTTKSLAEGTGLGLSISREIVTGDFDGCIEARSTVNEGSTFIVYIKKNRKEEPDAQVSA